MRLGCHISTAKPFSDSILRAREVGCECMQIFVNPPQRWNPIAIAEEEIIRFKELNREAKINPIIIHSIYLNNLASANSFFYEASVKSLTDDMRKAELIGALGVNTHLGSTKGGDFDELLPKVTNAIKQILDQTDPSTFFIIENAAGAGNIIGDTIEEIAKIIQSAKSDRVKVLIDTAHAFESGYDLQTPQSIEVFIRKFEKEIGLDKLVGFHLNDSKTELNSRRDRHADIGEGCIGVEAFKSLLNNSKLQDKFGILETPQDKMSWKDQLKLLRSFKI
ncbi:MAG: deoxyribonuclease IV [Patescibacteria group bacterium]